MSWYFTEEEKKYLLENYTKQTMFQMSQHLNRCRNSVRYQLQKVMKLRVPDEVRIKNRALRKQEALLKKQQRAALKAAAKIAMNQNPEKQVAKLRKSDVRPLKKSLTEPQIKIPETKNLVPYRIDHKTTIYLKQGIDSEPAIRFYQNLLNRQKRNIC